MADLKNVAKLAGVSIATVSRVINNSHPVRAETRFQVEKAMKELNYKPNRVAKRLRSKVPSGNLIGVLVPDIQNPFYVEVVRGIEEYLFERNYMMIMCDFSQDEKKQDIYLDGLISESVDGLIVAPSSEENQKVKNLVLEQTPVVCVDRGISSVDVDVVIVENEKGAYDAVTHLLEAGYRRISYISGLPGLPSSRDRESGYRKAILAKGLSVDEELIKYGDSKHQSGVKLAEELLAMAHPPDALFTGNNLITLGALETIHKHGLKIPEQIAVLGFDDMPWAVSLNPSLTAVRQPAKEIGKRAAELLIQRISEPQRPAISLILKTELVVRRST